MNHHRSNADPYYHHQSTSSASSSGAYQVFGHKLTNNTSMPDDDATLPTAVEAGQMNAFIDSYFESTSDVVPQMNHRQISKSRADEDLETLLKETDDMQDIQNQIQLEQIELAGDKYQEAERSKQKRAAAARSRYQRMSENERRLYNHRRRLRQLGVTPESMGGDLEAVKTQVRQANAKKAEAARQRYHRMTPEQKRDYNHRRTEAFRKRRQEEELLLSTPAGRISTEALAKAQQIMVRNARKAESARLRYQKMTQDERKAYNMRRAVAKKKKVKEEDEDDYEDYSTAFLDSLGDGSDMIMVDAEEGDEIHLEDLSSPNSLHPSHHFGDEMIEVDGVLGEEHILDAINDVAHPPAELDVFAQMEMDVLRRTKKANAAIMKNFHNHHINAIVGGIQYDLTQLPSTSATAIISSHNFSNNSLNSLNDPCISSTSSSDISHNSIFPNEFSFNSPSTIATVQRHISNDPRAIDEQALHLMVATGCDANGHPVEVRTFDGAKINCVRDLFSRSVSHGHTVLITQLGEEKSTLFDEMIPSTSSMTQDNHVGSTTSSSHVDPHYDHTLDTSDTFDFEEEGEKDDAELVRDEVEAVRARRAERARARYHRMSSEQRREQNARRAAVLRQSRARDEELLRIGETTPADQIDELTAKLIAEAQRKRARRAEQAREKYRRMNSEERKKYNQSRDRRGTRKAQPKVVEYVPDLMPDPEDPDREATSSPADPNDPSSFFFSYPKD